MHGEIIIFINVKLIPCYGKSGRENNETFE